MSCYHPVPSSGRIVLQHRSYALLQGALTVIDQWSALLGLDAVAPPAFVWPLDRAWCFSCDVDPHWAGIGASQAAIDVLADDEWLDVVSANPDEQPPAYR